ncbi:MAG: hypothetical protein OJJ54_16735 [Pseudonocardia sp.]|nr:hypothetical protein [Pseudonocardia sp.]
MIFDGNRPRPYAAPDPEQRLAEALHVHASRSGGSATYAAPGVPAAYRNPSSSPMSPLPPQQRSASPTPARTPGPAARAPQTSRLATAAFVWPLVIALLVGAVLGCALALVSILLPGVLPTIG